MDRKCIRCGNEIIELTLSEEQRIKINDLIAQDLKLLVVKKLMEDHGYNHREAKIIVDHLNKHYGKCERCNYNELSGQYVNCPKCKAFNYNIGHHSAYRSASPFIKFLIQQV